MLLPSELLTLPVDLNVLAGLAGLAAVGAVFSHDHADGQVDTADKTKRISELEKTSPRTLEQNEELSDLYINLASNGGDDDENIDNVIELYNKAEAVLKATLAQGDDAELRRKLGNVYLNRAVVYNDFDNLEEAEKSYLQAIDVFKPLDTAGDGEATYDLAGVELDLGVVYRENGDFEKAKGLLEDAFLLYRKIEKIGLLDTRYYMAKTSVQQGNVLFEMEEPLDKITDAYNRAMRLFVEVIEDEQRLEIECDLANTLLDRCTAVYHDILLREFDSETERNNKIGDVLIDVSRGIDLLEKQFNAGNEEARPDLFNALAMQANILVEIEKFDEGRKILDRVISEFADYSDPENIHLASEYAGVYETRANCCLQSGNSSAAIADMDKVIGIQQSLADIAKKSEPDNLVLVVPTLAAAIATRATMKAALNDTDAARKELQQALDLLETVPANAENSEIFDDIKAQILEFRDSLK
ncbi:hypothetical protein FACS1894170_06890 [Planctomycetales bacterium]|nr:hypothetical protein FACS1894170_06890 [Planctomycetales bacterium]